MARFFSGLGVLLTNPQFLTAVGSLIAAAGGVASAVRQAKS